MDPHKDPKTLAVVMACHNRREHTLACLAALDQQALPEGISVDVYLMDDGSTDGTAAAVAEQFPHVKVLEGDGNLFWNRGMHAAFSAAIERGYDFYLWLNDDSMLYGHALRVLLETHEQLDARGEHCAIVGSAMQDPDSLQFTYGGVRRYRNKWGRVRLDRIPPASEPLQCDASNGNCVLIPASVVARVGNLDDVFLHRWGDHDYCFRAVEKGCTVWLAPGYLGACRDNPVAGTWEDVTLPLKERWQKLNSPRGFQFHDYAIYMRRHRGPWWPAHLVWPYVKIVLQSIRH